VGICRRTGKIVFTRSAGKRCSSTELQDVLQDMLHVCVYVCLSAYVCEIIPLSSKTCVCLFECVYVCACVGMWVCSVCECVRLSAYVCVRAYAVHPKLLFAAQCAIFEHTHTGLAPTFKQKYALQGNEHTHIRTGLAPTFKQK